MPFSLAVRAGDPARIATPLLAVALPSDAPVPRVLKGLDRSLGGALTRAVRAKDFKGSRDETLLLLSAGRGPQRVLLVGVGPSPQPVAITRAATLAGRRGNAMGVERMAFWAEGLRVLREQNPEFFSGAP